MPEHAQPLETWAIVEVLGHKKFAGYVSEQVLGGAVLVRVDVPETDQCGVFTKPYTKLVGVGSIYCITPTTEEIARRAAQQLERWNNPIPVDIAARPQIPATSSASLESEAELVEGDDRDDDDDREAWQG
jgi:hypothetical protein